MQQKELSVPEDLRYPIGDFKQPEVVTHDAVIAAIETLAETPKVLRDAVEPMSPEQLNTPYREGGWTVLQVVHHIADSHANASIRVRLALTEDWPSIKAYDEKAWAELADADAPVEWSLGIIENTHARWVKVLRSSMRRIGSAGLCIRSAAVLRWSKRRCSISGTRSTIWRIL